MFTFVVGGNLRIHWCQRIKSIFKLCMFGAHGPALGVRVLATIGLAIYDVNPLDRKTGHTHQQTMDYFA
jgi:hypothetical protein